MKDGQNKESAEETKKVDGAFEAIINDPKLANQAILKIAMKLDRAMEMCARTRNLACPTFEKPSEAEVFTPEFRLGMIYATLSQFLEASGYQFAERGAAACQDRGGERPQNTPEQDQPSADQEEVGVQPTNGEHFGLTNGYEVGVRELKDGKFIVDVTFPGNRINPRIGGQFVENWGNEQGLTLLSRGASGGVVQISFAIPEERVDGFMKIWNNQGDGSDYDGGDGDGDGDGEKV